MDTSLKTKIFWFIVFITAVVLAYVIALTFVAIPKENVRFADTTQGFLLGSVLSAGISYLLGGSPSNHAPLNKTGTTSADVHITTTQENKEEKKE